MPEFDLSKIHPGQFLGLPPCNVAQADAVVLSLPLEKTVSYGTGTKRGPQAILDASCQIELFDEETLVDFAEGPRIHTAAPLVPGERVEDYLAAVRGETGKFRGKFVVALGGEHTVTHGVVNGLIDDPDEVTIVQIDAHADLIDELDGRRWSHGTVMRRLWDQGCRLTQIGIRSLSRSEYNLAVSDDRINTYFAHQLADTWSSLVDRLGHVEGKVYLSVDVDGLDPSVVPSTGTPQPNGLSWPQVIEVIRTLTANPSCTLLGADVVELIASPHPPGCDLTVARLVAKILAFWHAGQQAVQ